MTKDPLFIVAALACLGVLVILMIGIGGFGKGGDFNRKHANRIMRYRIIAQAVAVGSDPFVHHAAGRNVPHWGSLMVVLNKIYTKTGDAGETALGNGARVAKHSLRVTAYGTVDETNATVGLARLHAAGEMDAALARIQNDLFDLGADLCRPEMARGWRGGLSGPADDPSQVERLEA
jgi:hypothetical protein